MYTHILVPADGSPLSDHALEQTLELAKGLGARITVLTVIEPFQVVAYEPEQVASTRDAYAQYAREEAARRGAHANELAAHSGVRFEVVSLTADDRPE